MFGDGSPYDRDSRTVARALGPVRVVGGIRARFSAGNGTQLADLNERGGYRLKFPATHAAHLEATIINTGGGVVGGDRLAFTVESDESADAVLSTQAAERIYRSLEPPSEVDVTLRLAAGARLDWLPQETILFSGARLKRRFEVDMSSDARLLMVEAVVFGRIASGESPGYGLLHDVWRVRRDNRLVFADAVRLSGHLGAILARPAVAEGARAMAVVLFIGLEAEERLEGFRKALGDARSNCGASAWNGMLTARFLAEDPGDMRTDLVRAMEFLAGRQKPRVWAN